MATAKTTSPKKVASKKSVPKKTKSEKSTENNLVIVESPAKADTIKKYLGKNYTVVASMGHIIDLPKSQLGVDPEDNFKPKYITIRGKGDLLSKLKKQAKSAKNIYLATDPDREGEAISFHLLNALGIDSNEKCRITFNEITQTAVKSALEGARTLDMDLVNAQQARRILDRIVGYKISPLLWANVKKGLSAGRVQSVATRLICDREEEIENFIPKEYWSLGANLLGKSDKDKILAKFYGKDGKKVELDCEKDTLEIVETVKKADFIVESVKKGEQQRLPSPPFITSSLQQEASRKLGFSAQKTMSVAQQLYEGINIKTRGTLGLITYMRTDSLRVSTEAQVAAKEMIINRYGEKYAPNTFNVYKTKKGAQDAHEAIRPSYTDIIPEEIKASLTNDQFKLYRLIWLRFIASQMSKAILEVVNANIKAADYDFRASGFRILFDGFMRVYIEGKDNDENASEKDAKNNKETMLPELTIGQKLKLVTLEPKQHFTTPPPRYTEASLVRALEENGIGRPSTYAPTIGTIVSRGYIIREKKQLCPTELGMITTGIMKNNFADIVDVEFTAGMESELDEVEDGQKDWIEVLKEFYAPFKATMEKAEENIGKVEIADEVSDVPCDKCGAMMVYKMGKYGKFLACPRFPDCRNAKPITKSTGVACPKCGSEILVRKSKRGKIYYGCEKNPTCDFMSWDEPLADRTCPDCGSILFAKKFHGNTTKISCSKCDFEENPKKKSDKEE